MRVLFVKLSSLGDVVHTLPAAQDLLALCPGAQLDWVVEPGFAPVVRRCAGVQRVLECDLRRWRRDPLSRGTRAAWRRFVDELQRVPYDRVIDLQGLTKSALVSRLARLGAGGQRVAMANRTDGSAWEWPTRWVADQAIRLPAHIHALSRARELCAQAMGYAVPAQLHHGLLSCDVAAQPLVALMHGTSREDKLWPLAHWQALAQRLQSQGLQVALPHGSAQELARSEQIASAVSGAQVWPPLPLDALLDRLSACSGAIGVDSGLSHIAVALNLPHVQIYNHDTAWRTGPLPGSGVDASARQLSVFARPTPSIDAVWDAWTKVAAPPVGL